jgi:hypothetical protein
MIDQRYPFKFKAWDTTGAAPRMVSWEELQGFNVGDVFIPPNREVRLLQYTGRDDRHKVEIYAGDVIGFFYDEMNGWKAFQVPDLSFGIDHLLQENGESTVYTFNHACWKCADTLEVFGSAYADPTLLTRAWEAINSCPADKEPFSALRKKVQ